MSDDFLKKNEKGDGEKILTLENVVYELNIFSALKGISFSLNYGENVVIFGLENSGIDMLCSIIAGVRSGFQGEIYYKDKNILKLDYIDLNVVRKDLSYMQRGYGLIKNMNVWENIALPLRYHTKLKNREIEKIVDGYIEEFNLEYCQELRPVNLRMSEILKTAFARSIVLDPDLLLVEHPLEAQCSINTLVFVEKMIERSTNKNNSTLIVTYNPWRFLDSADRFIMIDYGSIVFDGKKEELLSKNNPYVKQYLGNETEGPLQII